MDFHKTQHTGEFQTQKHIQTKTEHPTLNWVALYAM